MWHRLADKDGCGKKGRLQLLHQAVFDMERATSRLGTAKESPMRLQYVFGWCSHGIKKVQSRLLEICCITLFARNLVLWCYRERNHFVGLVLKCLQFGNVLVVTIPW